MKQSTMFALLLVNLNFMSHSRSSTISDATRYVRRARSCVTLADVLGHEHTLGEGPVRSIRSAFDARCTLE